MGWLFYYGTTPQQAEQIVKEGFILAPGKFGDAVYLQTTRLDAKQHGEVMLAVELGNLHMYTQSCEQIVTKYPQRGFVEFKEFIVDSLAYPCIKITEKDKAPIVCLYELKWIQSVKITTEPIEKMVDIRNTSGEVVDRLMKPTVVYNKEKGTIQKIGEKERIKRYLESYKIAYQFTKHDAFSDNLVLIELPTDQSVVDKIHEDASYIKKFYSDGMQTT